MLSRIAQHGLQLGNDVPRYKLFCVGAPAVLGKVDRQNRKTERGHRFKKTRRLLFASAKTVYEQKNIFIFFTV